VSNNLVSVLPGNGFRQNTTPEWSYCALRILRNLLRSTPQNLSTQMISRSAAATTLLFLSHTLPLVLFCSAIATRPRRLVWTNKCSRVPRAIATERGESEEKRYGTISGRVVDQNGNGVAGTSVQIRCEQESAIQEVQSGQDGRFAFDRVTAGPFQLTATERAFVPQTISNTVRAR